MQVTHPTDVALRDFLLGKLPDGEFESVEAHLSECPACLGRAADESAHDTLMDLLASARTRLDRDRAAACTPHPDVFSTPALGAVTQTYSGPPTPGVGILTLPPELAGHPRYRVFRLLGYGGMGTVWLAEHTVMGRAVALKVVRPEWLARPGAAERFQREVRAAAKLKHEHIATAYDAEQVGDHHFLVMEYVPGESLADAVRRGPLPVAEACRAVRDAARGLAHAHAADLVHRDVKPGNLIRTPDGTTKVLDFGLVSAAEPEGSALTGENLVMGTPDYIAPEQADNPRAADARSDIYALGCTLYHLLAGRVPYPADSVLKKIDAHRDPACRPAPIPGVSPGLAAVVAKMMAKDPRGRYQTATAVLTALEPFASGTAPLFTAGRPRSVPRLAVAAGVLFVFLAAAVVYKIQRDNGQITITTDDPDIEVVMKRSGDLVRIVDNKTGQRWDLDTRKLRLKPDGSELSIDLPGQEPLTIRRNGDVAVTIRREAVPGPSPEPPGTSDPHLVRTFTGHTGVVRAVAYSADGKHILSGSGWPHSDGTVRLWDAETGNLVWVVQAVATNSVAFCGRDRVLVGGFDQVVQTRELKTGKVVRTYPDEDVLGTVFAVAASADGKYVMAGGDRSAARIWDAESGKVLHTLRVSKVWCVGVAFAPDGEQLATLWADGSARVWDAKSGKLLRSYHGTRDKTGHNLTFTPDGRHLVFGDDTAVVVWEWEADGARRLKGHTPRPGGQCVAVSADGKRLASGNSDRVVRVWDFDSGKLLHSYAELPHAVWGVAFSPDGRFLISGGGSRYNPRADQFHLGTDFAIRLWAVPDKKSAGPKADPLTGERRRFTHAGSVRAVAFSLDGKQILSGSGWPMPDNTLRLWDVASGEPVWAVKQKFNITAVAFAPHGEVLFGGSSGQGIHRADRKTGADLGRYAEWIGSRASVLAIAASANGQVVVSGSDDHKIRVWNPTTRTVSRLIQGDQGNVVAVAASADGKLVAGAAEKSVGVWDAKTGAATGRVYQYKSDVGGGGVGLAFTPDRKHLVFGDGTEAVLWNVETGVVVRTFAAKNTLHGSACVALSPDGKRLLTGGDKTVRLFDLASGELLKEFVGHKDRIAAVAFSPDGRFGVSGSGGNFTDEVAAVGGDNTVRVWELPEATKK